MPTLSVLLPALGGLETVRTALDRWQSQGASGLEVIVLCPDGVDGGDGLRVVDTRGLLLHEARARGVRESTAEYVFLAEDHCLPDEGWADAILPRLEEGWDAIGSRLAAGVTTDARSQAAFLLGYGEWMAPLETGPTRVLPGHNVVLRRRLLLELGDELEDLLVVGAFLVRRLRPGRRLLLVAEAGMTHYDVTAFRRQLVVFQTVGRSFGAMRTRRAPTAARVAYAAAFPFLAAAHWRRALAQYRRAGRSNGMRATCLAPAGLFAGVWGVGEALGALLGPQRVASGAWRSETKPVVSSSDDRKA
jgi:hypothetical protein